MSDLRSLLVHLDASPRCIERLRLAHRLASGFGARATGLYAVMPHVLLGGTGFADGSSGAYALIDDADAQLRAATRRLFERERGDGGSPLAWADLGMEPVLQRFAAEALFADLLVLGQYDAHDALQATVPPDLVPSVLLNSGKPGLVVPYAGDFTSIGQEVLVAWKPTRESARAVSTALPLLKKARTVHLALSEAPEDDTRIEGGLDLVHWLESHGVTPQLHASAVASDTPGESLLSLAADLGADLLVMGCYGHSRARELMLGGASRTVLQAMTLPVWMSH